MTGILELSVNNSTYHVADDSVVLKPDGEKYQDFDDLMSDSDSSEATENTERCVSEGIFVFFALTKIHALFSMIRSSISTVLYTEPLCN